MSMNSPIAKSPALADLEDKANSLTHAMGSGLFAAGLALLVVLAAATGNAWKIVSVSIYGFTLVLLYSSSALYHAARRPALRRALRMVDHASIYLLIAGTYTPFLLVNLRGGPGWPMFWTIWGLALAGVVANIFFVGRFKAASTALYIAMGWIIVVAIAPLSRTVSQTGIVLLLSGGLAYTLGAAFYLFDKRLPFGHAVWHLFVIGGSVCHFLAVAAGVIPYQG